MIFVTLGSQKFQFNRLLRALDDQIKEKKITDEVFAQTGASDYKPVNYAYRCFLDREEYAEALAGADIVLTHGGTGAIIGAVKKGKKVIAVPRLARYGEHVDDHQLQIIEQFRDLGFICECLDCGKIHEAVQKVKITEYKSYHSNTNSIIERIDRFICMGEN